ncbi:cam cdpk [Cystoisospora suis]|uniref:non-specific serine/threonine protein kinase n=1 Tax=Cystoisospora suis TaxID=483139 RepID=A0A2C6L6Z6_9APIC|nr:cam cdpk [Cystoisospora suis]
MRGLPDPSLLSSFRGFIFSEPFYPFKEARRYCAPIVSRVTVVVSPLGSPLLPQSRLSRFRGFCRSRGVRTRRAGELVVFGGFSEAPPCFCVLLFRSTTGKRFLGLADSPRNFTASAKQQACTPEGAFLPSKQEEGSVGLLQAGRKRRSDDLLSSSALDLFKNRISPLFRGGERDWDAGGVSTSPEASSSCYISQSFHSHSSFAPYLSFSFLCCQWPRFPYSPNSCLPLWTSCPLVEGRQPFTSFSFSLSSFEFYNFPCLLSRVEWCRGCPFRGGKPHCKKESISPSCLIHPRSISSPCPSPPTSFDPFTLMPSVAVPGPCTPSTDPLSTPASQPRTYPLSPLTTDCGGDSPAFLSQVPPTEVGVLSPSPRTHAETAVVVVSNQQAPALPTTLRGTEISPFQVGKVEVASCVPTATPPVTQPVHSYQTPREVALASPTCIPPPSFSGPFYVHAQQPGGPYTTPVLTAAGCGDTVQAYPFFSPRPGFSFPPAESSLRQQQAPVACVYTRTGTAPIALASPNTDIPIRTYDSSPHLTTTGSGVLRGQQAHSPPPPAPYNVNGRYWPSSSSGSGEGSQVAVAAHALPPVETGEPAAVCGPAIQNLVATDVGRGVPQGYNTTNDTIKRELWAAPQAAYAPAPVFGTPAPDCVLSSPQQHAQAVVHPAAPHVTPSFSPGLPPTTVNPSSCTPFPGGSPSSLAPGVPVRTLYKTEVLAGSPVVPAPAAVYRKHINLGNAIGAVTGRRSASYLACAPQPAVMADPSTRTMEKTGASSRSTKVTRHSQVPPASPAARQPRKLVATTPSPQKSPTKESPTYDVFNSVVSSTQQVEELHDRRRRIGDTGPSPELIREKLHKVMDVPNNFLKSARASFRQFDADGDGYLTFEDLRRLIERLCRNLQLPPVDDSVLRVIFEAFDSERRQKLNVEEFCRLYWELLGRIRDKFYPTRKMLVRRSVFVGRRNLDITQTSIEELFDFKKKLGAGAFGDVHLVVERSSGLERVIKTINKDRSQVPMEQIEAEIQVLKSLDHPNIIKIFEISGCSLLVQNV